MTSNYNHPETYPELEMELRTIDDQVFVVQQVGRREMISTPSEAIADQERIAAEADAVIAASNAAAESLEARIGEYILTSQPAAELRAELDALRETIASIKRNASNARAAAREVVALLDRREVDLIRQADAARLAERTAPYDQILKEYADVR